MNWTWNMYTILSLYVWFGLVRIAGTGSLSILREALVGRINFIDLNLAHLEVT